MMYQYLKEIILITIILGHNLLYIFELIVNFTLKIVQHIYLLVKNTFLDDKDYNFKQVECFL